jgi:hypothetical protein
MYTGREDEGEDVKSYWIILRKRKDTGSWKQKLWIALCGQLALEGGYGPVARRTACWMNGWYNRSH